MNCTILLGHLVDCRMEHQAIMFRRQIAVILLYRLEITNAYE